MNSKRMFFVLLAGVILSAVVFFAAIGFGIRILDEKSTTLSEHKLEQRVLERQQELLVQAKQQIEEFNYIDQIAQTVVPQDKDQARAVREIVQIAEQSSISLRSITFPSSNLGERVAPATPAPSTENDDESSDDETAPPTPAAPPISQAQPVSGMPGVFALEINITPAGDVQYYRFLEFLERLGNNQRTSQITNISINPTTLQGDNPLIDFSLTINIFMKP